MLLAKYLEHQSAAMIRDVRGRQSDRQFCRESRSQECLRRKEGGEECATTDSSHGNSNGDDGDGDTDRDDEDTGKIDTNTGNNDFDDSNSNANTNTKTTTKPPLKSLNIKQ